MKTILRFAVIGIGALLCFSCVNEELYTLQDVVEGEPASIRISLQKSEQPEIQVRTTGSGIDDNIKYVHILIFDAGNGNVLKTKKYIADYTGGAINLTTVSGNSIIYVVANLSDVNTIGGTGASYFDDVISLSGLQNKVAKINKINGMAEPLLIMSGKTGVVPINPGVNGASTVQLNRLSSKITILIKNAIPSTDRLELFDWQVASAPGYSYIDSKAVDAVSIRTETPADSNYFRSNVQQFTMGPLPGTSLQVPQGTFYLFENKKGNKPSVTNQRQRVTYAPVRATFVKINARYSDPSGVKNVIYNIHLGKDSLTDYNVERNIKYTYTITIKGANEYSTQVDISKQDSRVDLSTLCSFEINEPSLDAHYDWRPVRFRALKGYSKMEIVDASTGLPTTDIDKQWLKLSYSPYWPNNAQILANPAIAPVIQMINNHNGSGLNGPMVYAYAEEMFNGINPITADRKLKIKVTYTPSLNPNNLNIPDSCYVLTKELTQKPILTLGNMGVRMFDELGIIEVGGGSIFGIERREEAVMKLDFTGKGATGLTTMMPWAFSGIQKQPAILPSPVFYKQNGFKNTIALVYKNPLVLYNQSSAADIGSNVISGAFDPIYNTYAARYCFEKNRDLNGDGFISGSEIKWFLPARGQQVLLWIGKAALNATGADSPSESCWSSTENGTNNALNLNFSDGGTGGVFVKNNTLQHVRCLRVMENLPISILKSPYVTLTSRIITGLPAEVSTGLAPHTKGVPYPLHEAAGPKNAVAQKFEVAKADCNTAGDQIIPGSSVMEWYKACGWSNMSGGTVASPATGCNAYWETSVNDPVRGAGMWRLPTQRELMTIWLLQTQLIFDSFVPLAPVNYWSSPNYYTESWYTNFDTGLTAATFRNPGDPLVKQNVRCVRDVAP